MFEHLILKSVSYPTLTILSISQRSFFLFFRVTWLIWFWFTDYASSSDSESEQQLVEQAWRGDADSDAESVDSEQEDPLKSVTIFISLSIFLTAPLHSPPPCPALPISLPNLSAPSITLKFTLPYHLHYFAMKSRKM